MSKQISPTGFLELSSDPRDVGRLLTYLESILAASCLDEMSAFHLRCAVVEVVNNCIQHAYQGETGQPIEISYRLHSNDVQITVSDRGAAFQAPANLSEIDLMSESGRGLQIINAWVSTLEFKRRDGWNVCTLKQRIQD
jgi:anti-sigma regulatory factor (Ser/Thr protein kinase)